ncbi:hypothetical protein IIA95_02025 [Patescibacteria group bacterium]|nr:hypothetical protein [Patescibacteria group bacterium]
METLSTSSVSLIDLINLTHDVASLNAVYLGISMSAVLVLAGILFGVFYFFNLKPLQEKIIKQEDKLEAQKKEVNQVLKSTEDKIGKSLEVFKKSHGNDVNELIRKNNEKNTLETKNQIASIEKTLIEKIESVSEKKNIKLKEIILLETTNKINTAEKSTNIETNKLKTDFNEKSSSMNAKIISLEEKTFNLRRSLVNFEIEGHLKKGQVGAMRKMIEKLEMDIKKGWGEESTILKIKDYIAEKGMPSYYFDNLSKVVKKMPEKFKSINTEVLALAQKNLYDPNK